MLSLFVFRLNLDLIQSESNILTNQLRSSESKVCCSSEDLKEQYLPPLQVDCACSQVHRSVCLLAHCLFLLVVSISRSAWVDVSSCSSCCPPWRTEGQLCLSTCVRTAAASPLTSYSTPSRPSEACSSEPRRSEANHRPVWQHTVYSHAAVRWGKQEVNHVINEKNHSSGERESHAAGQEEEAARGGRETQRKHQQDQ